MLKSSVITFFKECIKEDTQIALNTLTDLLRLGEIEDYQISVVHIVLLDIWDQGKYDDAIFFLNDKSTAELKHMGKILEIIASDITKYDSKSNKIIGILAKLPVNSIIFNYFLPKIICIFQLRKAEFTNEEITYLTEAIKILMTVLIKSPEKNKITLGLVPLLLSLYHKSYPIQVIKAVSKALTYISTQCKDQFKKIINGLEESEKKFIEGQITSNNIAVSSASTQPTITLQLKFKKN